jgi:hypothetical protein
MKLYVGARTKNEVDVLPWFVANCSFADKIFIADNISTDGTWELLLKMAETDNRIVPSMLTEPLEPYRDQHLHFNHLFDQVKTVFEEGDYFVSADVDEIFTNEYQQKIRFFLENCCESPRFRIYMMNFYYLRHTWSEFYHELSKYPVRSVFSFMPVALKDGTQTGFVMQVPSNSVEIDLESTMSAVHFNYPMKKRFAKKREQYSEKFNYPSWGPEERHFGYRSLPSECSWYSPDGVILRPNDMRSIEIESSDRGD